MTKSNGKSVSHQLIDRLIKFEAQWSTKQSEVISKHNELASQITAQETILKNMAGFVASELGKMAGNYESRFGAVGRSLQGMDLNILAMGELTKEIIGQLTQVDALFKKFHAKLLPLVSGTAITKEWVTEFADTLELAESEVSEIKKDAEAWYADLLKSSFKGAMESIDRQIQTQRDHEAAQAAEAEKTKQDAELAEAALSESKLIEAELKKADETERSLASSASGGEGSPYPDGAEIWGG